MDNDARGWIMCGFSGLACILGATVVCVDIPIRLLPGKRNFRIQESNSFLASSLSLSFGVMLFSALYSMLPSAMRYLAKDGWDEHTAGFLMMGCFVGGFFGIQIISRVLHQYMPSHVVDCDHTHDNIHDDEQGHPDGHGPSWASKGSRSRSRTASPPAVVDRPHMVELQNSITESTPLISTEVPRNGHVHTELYSGDREPAAEAVTHFHGSQRRASAPARRPSAHVRSRVLSFFKDTKANCDEDGPCYGYTDPCGQECFKHLGSRSAISRAATARILNGSVPTPPTDGCEESCDGPILPSRYGIMRTHSHDHDEHSRHHGHAHTHAHDSDSECAEDCEAQHHHHVPTNAFLSIGLQTVIAIALHKFPEGFITYATNHANPLLGFNVFMALFVHNIAEGFAMALPLYMALGSRVKAILWSSLLGGLSQPLGAAVAVAWFKLARRSNVVIDSTAYACLFAVTAGIMVSVALQLFVESLSLNHNRNLSIFFAFLGMTLLGISNALVSH
ncbi:Zinc/iron permease [Parathielavia appendiculata]|uniref:Zinc/iron permease n=1 Tax=Parathielavia appendiculata TaxID=2587402 RepID=A0AAN6U195_9PEZI|nr:Zinc/iron permease [Parathielavia appendiculata]